MPDEPATPKVMAVKLNGKPFPLWDLPIEVVEDIASRHGVFWLDVIQRPMQTLTLAKDLIAAMAAKVSAPMPELSSTRVLYDLFEVVDDDLPYEYSDGIPKMDGPETTG